MFAFLIHGCGEDRVIARVTVGNLGFGSLRFGSLRFSSLRGLPHTGIGLRDIVRRLRVLGDLSRCALSAPPRSQIGEVHSA
mgnify:CR=1 FL=1